MSKAHLLLGFGLVCMIMGFIVAWPLVYAATMYSTVWGKVITVLVISVDETRSQVSIAYEYRLKSQGSGPGDLALGWALADDRLQMIDDPIVSHEMARRTQEQFDGRTVRIHVDMNRPYDSAFMLNPLNQERPFRPEQGALLVMLGICCSILAQLTRIRR